MVGVDIQQVPAVFPKACLCLIESVKIYDKWLRLLATSRFEKFIGYLHFE
jgi:hypothetical protein